MYRVNKEVGTSENVFLQNTDNGAELNLGRITPTMIHMLEEDGYKFDDTDGAVTLKEKWTLNVSESTKDKLRKLAMPMNKPVRDQRKKVEEDKKQPVDILDIIYGLA